MTCTLGCSLTLRSFLQGQPGLLSTALVAVLTPVLIAYNVAPSATFYNQAAALVGWGIFGLALLHSAWTKRDVRVGEAQREVGAVALNAAWVILSAGAAVSWLGSGMLMALFWSSVGLLGAGAMALHFGFALTDRCARRGAFIAVCVAFTVAGAVSAGLAVVQVHLPTWANGDWVASVAGGRAAGNLRQANHLSSLMLWSILATVALGEARVLRLSWVLPLVVACTYALVLTASRTGALSLIALVLWGLLDRRLRPRSRVLLLLLPVLYALLWWVLRWWSAGAAEGFAGADRFSTQGDVSADRFAIWSNALQLILRQPWTGVGSGEFNLAWTLTPFADRPTQFFDHAHNLPIQLAVELGLPATLLIIGLLVLALWRAWRASALATDTDGMVRRVAFMMVLLISIHSMLEYPLWYSYFLLPTAFFWGLALSLGSALPGAATADHGVAGIATERQWSGGAPADANAAASSTYTRATISANANADPNAQDQPGGLPDTKQFATATGAASWHRHALAVAAGLLTVGGVVSVIDYQRVAIIFSSTSTVPLEQRIADGKRSLFFAHHAHYAAATTAVHPLTAMASFDVAKHHLLDTRLMVAWAKAYAELGDLERARHIAARLREFGNPDSRAFFEPCDRAGGSGLSASSKAQGRPATALADSAVHGLPFQCTPPTKVMDYRDFR